MSKTIENLWESLPPTSRDNKNLLNIFNDLKNKTKKVQNIILFDPVGKKEDYIR